MSTRGNAGTGQGTATAEEIAQSLREALARRASGAPLPRGPVDDGTVIDAEAAHPAATEIEVADEAPGNDRGGDEADGALAAPDNQGALASLPDEVIQLAQAPGAASGAAKPEDDDDDAAAAGIPLLFIGGGVAAAALLGGGGGGSASGVAGSGGGGAGDGAGETGGGGSGGGGDGGGDGGGGGGGSSPALISDFAEFNAEAGGASPNVETDGSAFLITGGFDRDVVTSPKTLAQLPLYDLSVDGAEPVELDYHGLEVQLSGNANVLLAAAAIAGGEHGAQDVIWLANLGVVGHATDGMGHSGLPDAVVGATAVASEGGDAEIGVSNLYVDLAGAGKVIAAGGIVATASDAGSKAAALVGNDLEVRASGDSASAFGVVAAHAEGLALAHASVGGSLIVSANGGNGSHASVIVAAHGPGASVSIENAVAVDIKDRGEAEVRVSASDGGEVRADEVQVEVAEDAKAKVYLQFVETEDEDDDDDDGDDDDDDEDDDDEDDDDDDERSGRDVEALNGDVFIDELSADVDGLLEVYVGQLAGADADRSAHFSGQGDVQMTLHDELFGRIDVSELVGAFDLWMYFEDGDPAVVPTAMIVGYDVRTDEVRINGDELDARSVAFLKLSKDGEIDAFDDQTELWGELEKNLKGNDDYAFAVYSGVDITGDGEPEQRLGVLAYDDNGKGITVVMYLPEIDTVQELIGTG